MSVRRSLTRIPVWILALIVVLIAARAALPWALKSYINKTLDRIPGYYGHVDDVDVALYRGAYQIEGVELLRTQGSRQEPFFAADQVDISIDWRALFHRRLVTKIALERPRLQFIQRKSKAASQTRVDESWQMQVEKLIPFEINTFVIRDGLIRYKDQTRDPKINIYLSRLDVNSQNISNVVKTSERLPSSIDADGLLLKSGRFKLRTKADLLSDPAEADVNASIRGLDLKEINDFAKAYGNFDFEKGKFDIVLELAASKKRYDGYAKTLMKDVDVVDLKKDGKEGDSIGHLAWEGLVGAIMDIFKNHGKDRFAARIPIAGTRKDLKINTWATVGSILRNTFVRALSPDFEESVDFGDVSRAPSSVGSEKNGESQRK